MRIISPIVHGKEWWLHIFFREIGRPFPVKCGRRIDMIGLGREFYGQFKMVSIRYKDQDPNSVEFGPGARILGIIISPSNYIDQRYCNTLTEKDEVELVSPSSIAVVSDMELARDIVKATKDDNFFQQVEVLEGKRRRLIV